MQRLDHTRLVIREFNKGTSQPGRNKSQHAKRRKENRSQQAEKRNLLILRLFIAI